MSYVLIFLPRINSDPTSLGGSTVLSELMVDYINENKIKTIQIATNKFHKKNKRLNNYFYIILMALIYIPKSKCVVLCPSDNLIKFFSPFLYLITRIYRKKLIIKTFGSNADTSFSKLNFIHKEILKKTFFRSDIIFHETKGIAKFYKENVADHTELVWFPNCRPINEIKQYNIQIDPKFVFMSTVSFSKGVDIILEANEAFNCPMVDVYGPIIDKELESKDTFNSIKGHIDSSDVLETLLKYDVLVLPTNFFGEGYPGIILEAMSLGIPVIASNHRYISEIVQDGFNGKLLRVNDTENLINAIRFFLNNKSEVEKIGKNAFGFFNDNFCTEKHHKNLFDKINEY
ncbi:MAG: hypothetical protein CMC31_01085 [Flavobacteriaceae bacterium]|nr:hypothetical protein [Flavobacteriaceae bacterium]|tara:strand:- start:665 stop:1699 length:1035 start_codon:yes stop_codon:yes gene_type:complete